MRALLLVARAEGQRRIRNRSALFTAFLGPLVLAVVFGVLIGGGSSSVSFVFGIVDLDRSELSAGFTDSLVESDSDAPVTFQEVDDEASARKLVDAGDLDAALIVPSGFATAATSGEPTTLVVLRDPAKEISGAVARSIAGQFTAALSTRTLATATVVVSGGTAPTVEDLLALQDTVGTSVVDEPPGGRQLDAASFFGMTMSILFLFFTTSFAARSLIEERGSGVLARMLATPTKVGEVVVGKVLAVSVLGLAGFITVWLVTTLAFGGDWGRPGAILVVMVATVLAVGGVAVFVCGLARTPQQADGYTATVAFVLALLGGNFIGPGQSPEVLERISGLTPNGQAISAFTSLAVDGASVADVAGQILALLAIALVFGAIGLWRAGRMVRA